MGKLIYEGMVKVDFEDRTLAHLQAVISAKLRRRESLYFSWRDDPSLGDGRTTVWLHPRCSLVYRHTSRMPAQLNAAWLQALAHTSDSPSGLYLVREPPHPTSETGKPSEG